MSAKYGKYDAIPSASHKIWRSSQAQLRGSAWSMPNRHKDLTKSRSPGPAYFPKKLNKSLSYSMGIKLPSELECKDKSTPGPNTYHTTDGFKATRVSTPRYSIRLNTNTGAFAHLKRSMSQTPRGTTSNSNSKNNKNKQQDIDELLITPNYKADSRYKGSPQFSIPKKFEYGTILYKHKDDWKLPGPTKYKIDDAGTWKDLKIQTSIKGRHLKSSRFTTPAPNKYYPDRSARPQSSRQSSFGVRYWKKDFHSDSPGPIYNTTKPWGYQP